MEEIATVNLGAPFCTAVGAKGHSLTARSTERPRNGRRTWSTGYAAPVMLQSPVASRAAKHTNLMRAAVNCNKVPGATTVTSNTV